MRNYAVFTGQVLIAITMLLLGTKYAMLPFVLGCALWGFMNPCHEGELVPRTKFRKYGRVLIAPAWLGWAWYKFSLIAHTATPEAVDDAMSLLLVVGFFLGCWSVAVGWTLDLTLRATKALLTRMSARWI